MRRRHQRSPQNHALVASVAGVILLCGVVSVQTTQASQAFSHEQGMARMAAPQGSDAGATTAGDATWWSFWRAVRTLPHAYDAATATVLGAGDRGHASLDRALAEKRAEIERLRAQTASLKAEQARILAQARSRAALFQFFDDFEHPAPTFVDCFALPVTPKLSREKQMAQPLCSGTSVQPRRSGTFLRFPQKRRIFVTRPRNSPVRQRQASGRVRSGYYGTTRFGRSKVPICIFDDAIAQRSRDHCIAGVADLAGLTGLPDL